MYYDKYALQFIMSLNCVQKKNRNNCLEMGTHLQLRERIVPWVTTLLVMNSDTILGLIMTGLFLDS